MERFFDDHLGKIFICLGVIFVVLMGWLMNVGAHRDERLLAQCIADGKKEYECAAMLRRDRTFVAPLPVVIRR